MKILDSSSGSQSSFSFFKISTIYENQNILVVLDTDKLVHPLSHSAIEQVIHAFSFSLIRKQIYSENINRVKSTLFFDLIYGNISNENSFLMKASQYGLKENMKYVCITGSFDYMFEQSKMNYFYQSKLSLATNHIINSLERDSKKLSLDTIVFTQNNNIIIILQIDAFNKQNENALKTLLIQSQVDSYENMTISFGISASVRSILQIKAAYLNSLEALNFGYNSEKHNFIQSYKANDPKDIFCMLPEKTIYDFSQSILKDLATSSSKEHQELLETLYSFIKNRFDIAKTSRELFLHRNTVKYRLAKCEELLDVDLHDYSDVLSIQLAMELNSIAKKHPIKLS